MPTSMPNHCHTKLAKPPVMLYRTNQQGAALIVVLLFLVLIMLAGVMAVRRSSTDLKTATADQINTLLLQSSDSANQKLENMVNGSPTSQEYKDVMSVSGVFGHFLLNPDNQGNEFIYCYNPRTKKYLTSNATVLTANKEDKWSSLNNGICDYNSPAGYTSARQTVMTQMSVSVPPSLGEQEVFSYVVIGKEIENRSSKKFNFNLRATSVLPVFNAPKDDNTSCLSKSSVPITTNGVTSTPLIDCLHKASTPTKMLFEQVEVQNDSSSIKCVDFGKGSGQLTCQLS